MQKRAPTLANILVIVLFALSCFGLLLFLWESFGGPVPLKPKGYRFTVQLQRTLALAEQSDVRISGVPVGHVISLKPDNKTGLTLVTIEMDHQYAPVNSSDRLILRQKTLLGETFVELMPKLGSKAPPLADGGRIPISHVEPTVTLDDIMNALNPKTREAFQQWMQTSAAAFNGRGEQINSGFAELQPFIENASKLVSVLASQEAAVSGVIRNTGVVFDALTERDNQFRGLIENGEHAFHALSNSSRQWADAFRKLPAFERNGTATLRELDKLADEANPLLDQLRPVERQLGYFLGKVRGFTPAFNRLLTDLGPFARASKNGLPAFEQTLRLLTPVLGHVSPTLNNFDPFLKFLGNYIPELQSFFANATAATEAHDDNADDAGGAMQHYLRILNTVTPEGLAIYSKRIGTNRANPYFQPGAFRQLSSGLPVFESKSCADSAPSVTETKGSSSVSEGVIKLLLENKIVNAPESTENKVPAPACKQQGPFEWEGKTSQYPHVTPTASK